MRRIDRDIHLSRALVVDGNATSRSILVAQLRDFGLGTVVQCGRVGDARSQLETHRFDVVLCEHDFSGSDYSGQQLLDDLRRHQILPLSTVFIMITGEATYAKVAEAAESALDGYLLKPHTASALGERLSEARQRKRALNEIFDAIDEGRFDDAATLCLARFQARAPYWLFAARLGAELLLNGARHAEARSLYDTVLKSQALPWARLGIARVQLEEHATAQAIRTLESLIADQPSFVDAYDVMGRAHVESGDLAQAAAVYERAASLTPGSVGRLQKLGMLSFYMGDTEAAAKALDRAVSIGINSKMFDSQTLVLQAFVRFHQKDGKGLQRCVDNLAHALSRARGSDRLRRFAQVVEVFSLLLHKQVADAVQAIRSLAREVRAESFDVEAGCNLLAMLAQLTAAELTLEGVDEWVDAVGLRFCTSRALTELLVRAASAHEPFAQRIKACHQRVFQASEAAMAHSLAGKPEAAARVLLERGAATLNGKLIDTARLVLQRHQDKVPDAAALLAQANDLKQRFAATPARASLGEGNGRKTGGVAVLAVAAPAAPAPATAD